jgi:hypothetical protein
MERDISKNTQQHSAARLATRIGRMRKFLAAAAAPAAEAVPAAAAAPAPAAAPAAKGKKVKAFQPKVPFGQDFEADAVRGLKPKSNRRGYV